MLPDAQNLRAITNAPWLLLWPSLFVMVAVLSFNFLGDGPGDAADPVVFVTNQFGMFFLFNHNEQITINTTTTGSITFSCIDSCMP